LSNETKMNGTHANDNELPLRAVDPAWANEPLFKKLRSMPAEEVIALFEEIGVVFPGKALPSPVSRRGALATIAAAAVALPAVQAEASPEAAVPAEERWGRVKVTLPAWGPEDGLHFAYVGLASDFMRDTPGLSFETALELAWTC
jgi:hypothetical protein